MSESWTLSPDRYLDSEHNGMARQLYESVEGLPIIAPHGHVPPDLLADPEATLGTPAELFINPRPLCVPDAL